MLKSSLPGEIFTDFFSIPGGRYKGKPAFFIDRDGVMVKEMNYLSRREDVSFIPGLFKVLKKLNTSGIPVIMITNQAGIGRGYFTAEDFNDVQDEILCTLKKNDVYIDGVLMCPFHQNGVGKYKIDNHPFRKPNPGMIFLAQKELGIDLGSSWLAGDKISDIMAAVNSGLRGAVHVKTGHGQKDRKSIEELSFENFEIILAESIASVDKLILTRILKQ